MLKTAQGTVRGGMLTGILAGVLAMSLCAWTPAAMAEPATSSEALRELTAQQERLDQASSQYFNALASYQDAVTKRDEAEVKLADIEVKLADAQNRLGKRAREVYRNGLGSWVDVVLGSVSFDELTRNVEFLNMMNMNDAALIQEERNLRSERREQKAVMEEQVQRTSHAADEAYSSFKQAEDLTKQIHDTYQRLNAEEQAYIAAQAALQVQAQAEAQAQAAAQQAANDQVVIQAVEESGATVNNDGTVTDASGTTYSSPVEYSAATGNAIVDRAMAQLGASYVWGGVGGSDGGFDCSGFVSYALTGENERLGTTATFSGWNEVTDPQPGDVAVIHDENGSQHTGIYIGDGQMVHAADESTGVVVSNVQDGMKFVRQ